MEIGWVPGFYFVGGSNRDGETLEFVVNLGIYQKIMAPWEGLLGAALELQVACNSKFATLIKN